MSNYELSLRIEFSKDLSEREQTEFWDFLIEEIEKINVYAGGGHDSNYVDWVLDYSNSSLKKHELIDTVGDLLFKYDEKILNFKIE